MERNRNSYGPLRVCDNDLAEFTLRALASPFSRGAQDR
jgi:hypothetical protein